MSQKQPTPLPANAHRKLPARDSLDRSPEGIDSPANAYLAPTTELQTLRDNFFEYTCGRLSEKDFKAAVSEYAESLRRRRESAPACPTARPAQ